MLTREKFQFLTRAMLLILSTTLAFAADAGKNGRIAFFANLSGSPQIYTVNPDGTDLFQVTNLPRQMIPSPTLRTFHPTANGSSFPML
jgi:hypothetical protein